MREPMYQLLTPLELMEIQAAQLSIMVREPAWSYEYKLAEEIRNAVNTELEERGRCVYCGMRHSRRNCHIITGDDLEA